MTKEIEGRFYGPLEFGTAGLRGTMAVGLHNMNVHVIRHATQAFAEVILAEGPEAASARAWPSAYDCRNHSQEFAREAACVMAANGIPVPPVRGPAPHPRAVLRRPGVRLHRRHQRHRQPQPQGVQRL